MDLQKMIMDELNKKFESGEVQKKVEEQANKLIDNALNNALTGYDGVGRKIEEKLRKQMCEQIEKYNFDEYLPKLDMFLKEVISSTTLEHRNVLNNFKEFMKIEKFSEVKMSEIFEKYKIFVSENVDTSKLEANDDGDGGAYYQCMNCYMHINKIGYLEKHVIVLGCEEDEDMRVEFDVSSSYRGDNYLNYKVKNGIKMFSLALMNSFDVYLVSLEQKYIKIDIDCNSMEDEVEVEEKPEYYLE